MPKIDKKRARMLLAERGWSQSDLADQVGLTSNAVSMWMSGVRNPAVDSINKAAAALEVSPSYLRGEDVARDGSPADRQVPDVARELVELLERGRGGSGPVIGPGDGRRRGRTYMKKAAEHLRKLSGVEAAGWQVLRHTFASTLVSEGVPIYSVSKLLGHSSVKVTERHYAALAPSELGAHIERLSY